MSPIVRPSKEQREAFLTELAESQFGVFCRSQALALGYLADAINRKIQTARWIVMHRGVYRLAGVPESLDQLYIAAVLYGGPGALLAGEPAGYKWGLDTCRPLKAHIVTLRNIRDERIRALRTTLRPPAEDRFLVDRIPVTSPTRTLIDLASLVSSHRLQHALDSALRKQLTTTDLLQARIDALSQRGRRGIGTLQRFVREAMSSPTPDSWLERTFISLLRHAGFGQPIRQFTVDVGWRNPIHIDFAYPDLLIGIETDGYEPHSARPQWQEDRRRDAALALRGWLILRFSRDDIVNRPDYVLATLRAALHQRRAALLGSHD
jgi:very-short-patch-repair endonuclease